ncbi:MAG: flagellar basal body P-ring protein FlgI [Planctomycetaceae bacterium]|jgi:flagellar basal body P-ring protein FlgI|nr:flagellar basal body P-ring protein FlgI [Planctomycetaceae bacterium]
MQHVLSMGKIFFRQIRPFHSSKSVKTGFIILIGLFFLTGFVFVQSGCSQIKTRKQTELVSEKFNFETEDGTAKLIGDCANIGNYHPIQVQGYGLVNGLPGTGGDDVNSLERRMVYDEMTRMGIRDVRAILANPTTAVVNILGYMRPGIQEGDFFDVEVRLPPETSAKSLRGGWLMTTKLEEMAYLGGSLKEGKTLALVQGPIMIDDPLATESSNPSGLKQGIILSGARVKESRSLILNMKSGAESVFATDRIAKEINNRFFVSAGQKKGMATAKTDSLIVLDVHPDYAKDVARYVRVILAIACYENPAKQLRRIERLKTELLIPEKSQQAAFQLEAIGKKGIESLRSALNNPNPEVRFHAATSLAYLGDGTSAKILAEIARNEPAFRVYALNALSVLRTDIEAEMALQELLHVSSAETRYGAFRALYNRNQYDRTIRGENLGNQFSYHGITTNAPAMVHISKSKRPEIVLFGSDIYLKQPFGLEAGAIIFVNGQSPQNVVVKKFVLSGIDEQRTVSNKLDDVIRAVVELGGTYPDVFQMLIQADQMKVLSCRLEIDCLPEPNRVYHRPGSNNDNNEPVQESAKKKTIWERMNPKNWFNSNPGEKSSDFEGTINTSERE